MRKIVLIIVLFISVATIVGAGFYAQHELQKEFPERAETKFVEIPQGRRARDIVQLLHEKNVIRSPLITLAYIWYSGNRQKLQAGEYQFDRPLTPIDVVKKLAGGGVYLHKFTV